VADGHEELNMHGGGSARQGSGDGHDEADRDRDEADRDRDHDEADRDRDRANGGGPQVSGDGQSQADRDAARDTHGSGDAPHGSDHAPTIDAGLISGRYRLGELLGSGGSASVFAAVDVGTGESVALKLLHPHLSQSPAARSAFFAEARAAEVLRHPNIAGVRGVGVHESGDEPLAWIALEHAAGTSLAELVERTGPLSVSDALAVADGVLSALEYAHQAGLIHRDVSPANIMVARDPRGVLRPSGVRLVDFGLADAAGRAAVGADVLRTPASENGDDAKPGGVLGNVNYLSPEQARGEAVDERGDIYQFGAVLYFSLVGRPPFVRDSARAVMLAHLQTPPPVPSVARPGTPRAIDRLVVKAMLKDPSVRFTSAAEMRVAVRAAATHLGTEGGASDALGRGKPGTGGVAFVGAPGEQGPIDVDAGAATDATRVMALPPTSAVSGLPAGSRPFAETETTVLPRARARARTGGAGGTTQLAGAAGHSSPSAARSTSPGAGGIGAPGSDRGTSSAGAAAIGNSAEPRGRLGLWLVVGLAASIVVVTWVLASGSVSPSTFAADSPETSAPPTTPSESPTPTAPPPAVPVVAVPDLATTSLSAARDALAALGLTLGTVTAENSALAADTVLGVDPVAGSSLEVGATVNLVVASGSNVVPRVAGSQQAEAVAGIRGAGFETIISTREDDAAPGTVLATVPADGAVTRLGTTVSVVIAVARTPVPTSTPTPTGTPTPTSTPEPTSTAPPHPSDEG
jgi:serine/threonine-protein kinase